MNAKPAPNVDSLKWQRGLGVIGWLLMIPVVLVVLLILAVGFYEGRKAYWDHRVLEMCAKDGGIFVYERVSIPRAEYELLGGQEGMIPIPHEKNSPKGYPFVSSGNSLLINESNPRVYKSEEMYLRTADKKVLAISIQYSRVGGDFPLSYAHPSSFACPDQKALLAKERTIFLFEENTK
jgi:hypothetical protein